VLSTQSWLTLVLHTVLGAVGAAALAIAAIIQVRFLGPGKAKDRVGAGAVRRLRRC
jgi:hypothetical protein